MAKAGEPKDDKHNAAVDHVAKNFPKHDNGWYVPSQTGVAQGRPSTYEDMVNIVQACLLLGVSPTGEALSAVLVDLAKRITDLTDRIAVLEAKP